MSRIEGEANSEKDAAAVDRLAAGLTAGDTSILRAHFAAHGAAQPTIIWSPGPRDLGTPVLQSFAEICDGIATEEGFVNASNFRLEDFDGLDRWMMVLSRENDGHSYRHYGSEIANFYGRDMTGRSTADFEGYIGAFFSALYTAAARRRERVLSAHEPPLDVFVRTWRRLIVPLVDDGAELTGFVVANVAENELRAGLDMIVDPVFVADGEGRVQYCNDAAQRFFGIGPGQRDTLEELTGFGLADLPPPELLLTRREIVERLELVERRGQVMERLGVTISAAEHRGRAFYVVLMRGVTEH